MFAPQIPGSKSSSEPSPQSGALGLASTSVPIAVPRTVSAQSLDQTLQLHAATIADLDQLVELDRLCFGTLWSSATYARELDSPNSDIFLLRSLRPPRLPPRSQPQSQSRSQPRSQPPTQEISRNPTTALNHDLINPDPPQINLPEIHDPEIDDSTLIPPALGYGCIWAILDEAHITILGVHPQYRRQGFGDVLLHGLLWAAHQRGLTRATLEVSTENHAAIALYEKLGFQQAGCRKRYYANGDDAAILWKSSLQHPRFCQDLATLMAQHRQKLARFGWTLTEPPAYDRRDCPD